jgi:hypothetical protein
MITEQEYLEALKTIDEYEGQIRKQNEDIKKHNDDILLKIAIKKTPCDFGWSIPEEFPTMSVRLWNILKANFDNTRICDITKEQLLSKRNAGKIAWLELCEITKKQL